MTLAELVVEAFFPADERTARACGNLREIHRDHWQWDAGTGGRVGIVEKSRRRAIRALAAAGCVAPAEEAEELLRALCSGQSDLI